MLWYIAMDQVNLVEKYHGAFLMIYPCTMLAHYMSPEVKRAAMAKDAQVTVAAQTKSSGSRIDSASCSASRSASPTAGGGSINSRSQNSSDNHSGRDSRSGRFSDTSPIPLLSPTVMNVTAPQSQPSFNVESDFFIFCDEDVLMTFFLIIFLPDWLALPIALVLSFFVTLSCFADLIGDAANPITRY
jgi:hypothetical protein